MQFNEIHADARGKISLLTEDMKWDEVTVFKTNAGFARGGCIHEQSDEYTVIIEGEVIYNIAGHNLTMRAGDNYTIRKGTPHYFISVTDSIVLEWGAKPEEKKEKHLQSRAIVDNFNKGKII